MITLKQYAAAMAAIDAGKPLLDVIGALGLDPNGWETAHAHWTRHLQAQVVRGERIAVDKYQATYNRQRAAVERELSESTAPPSDAGTRKFITDDTAPLAPESTLEPPPPAQPNRTEPMSAEALAAFQAAKINKYTGLPFKPTEWTLDRYEALEEQINHHPGAVAAVLAYFDIDFAQYVTLRKRFADALKARRRAAEKAGGLNTYHRKRSGL